ncbi:biopolymer transporter ExbD [Burkholderia pyrrocinia]|uniref:ExbD/TolR family protein n=1 Tax=Burkholderia pyrrocinia TaxID=60550 RepID=UPI002AB20707|nr:biopolymer transporter ExbD [Burkholderia pyrrocinia]
MASRHLLHDEDEARIEIIPMIDIMMFLLVFFIMMTLKMISNAGITQDLPGNAMSADVQKINKLIIGVSASDKMTLNGAPITSDALDAALKAARANEISEGKVNVLIATEKRANLQDVMRVADAVRRANIIALGVATQADSLPADHGSIK